MNSNSLAVVETNSSDPIEMMLEWTPESLLTAINREKQLRTIIIGYCREAMREGHHYYNLPGQDSRKPALSKEGALNLCSLFKVTPHPDQPAETFHEDGHYTVRSRCHLLGRNGAILAVGDGLCSTRESKYAYRWLWSSEVPEHVKKEDLKKREWEKNGRKNIKYCVPNEDLPDLYNTVLKMSLKRAIVDATLKLPLVSELFTQDLDEQISSAASAKAETATRRTNQTENRAEPPRSSASAGNGKSVFRERALTLRDKLLDAGEDIETLTLQLLPPDVATFEELTEEQAKAVVPKLSEYLNQVLSN
ncbi:MAG: hypothetical protein M3209_09700 [Acidobacteriota bacterium]|nr:hypothetical protein [Acidobacteriota bacterium]